MSAPKAPGPDFVKKDTGKNPLHLLPTVALESVGEVLAFGAKKYSAHSWRAIDARSRYYSAVLRHLFAWWRGEQNDPESGLPHLAHAACSLLFLLEASVSGLGVDDRPDRIDEEAAAWVKAGYRAPESCAGNAFGGERCSRPKGHEGSCSPGRK